MAEFLIEQGFQGAELIAWIDAGIPDIALALILEYYAYETQERYRTQQAKLCCRAFNSIGIRVWVHNVIGWQKDSVAIALPPREISEAIASVFCLNTIDPNLIQGLIANEIGKAHPALKPHMEAAKKLLPLPVEQELLTVTDLARKFVQQTGATLSEKNTDRGNAMALNKLLIELGLQVKNTQGRPDYLPTEFGEPFSKVVLQEGNGSNKTCQQLRWYPKVLERLA